MKKLLAVSLMCLAFNACAGTGFDKRCTLMPDSVKLEADTSPEKDWRCTEVTMGGSWNLK